jgi:hypothetical protein
MKEREKRAEGKRKEKNKREKVSWNQPQHGAV